MQVCQTATEVAAFGGCVLVPTMGALHEGHAALLRQGAALATERGLKGGCVATIFVNPTQFNDPADLERYPRTLDADVALCASAGVAAVFVPDARTVYPGWPNHAVPTPALPRVATEPGLEDAHRPGHFAGVCQVVLRLFELCRPAVAIFGEKDWQQLQVICAMTAQHGLGVEIVPGPTVREADGLAMSSRNRFLDSAARAQARCIFAAIGAAGREPHHATAEARLNEALRTIGHRPDYATIRDAQTLLAPTPHTRGYRTLVAARVGTVRLIDNAPWPMPA